MVKNQRSVLVLGAFARSGPAHPPRRSRQGPHVVVRRRRPARQPRPHPRERRDARGEPREPRALVEALALPARGVRGGLCFC